MFTYVLPFKLDAGAKSRSAHFLESAPVRLHIPPPSDSRFLSDLLFCRRSDSHSFDSERTLRSLQCLGGKFRYLDLTRAIDKSEGCQFD